MRCSIASERGRFLIDGEWIEPGDRRLFEIVTPSDETVFASVPLRQCRRISTRRSPPRGAPSTMAPGRACRIAERGDYLNRIADAIEAKTDAVQHDLDRTRSAG